MYSLGILFGKSSVGAKNDGHVGHTAPRCVLQPRITQPPNMVTIPNLTSCFETLLNQGESMVMPPLQEVTFNGSVRGSHPVSYTHLRAHETPEHLVCRLLLEKKKTVNSPPLITKTSHRMSS
eukprot:TRINITY_DN12408_c0_g1_i2.p1 TRINITY_DN12408_c0_g1~~TRINITY_DN12408_c0_g1_i2.p1  ORF type:complete len:122 (+),score=5.29 TRINITY_DN12408_c0_g1_i2:218-583(+)